MELLNTRDVAVMYHVTSATVLNWIRSGKLKAYATPGGHYRVAREDLEVFSREYGAPPEIGVRQPDLRLLMVGSGADLFERVCREILTRWPKAQVEQAESEFEVGWWLARLRPTHILVHPGLTDASLLDHCLQMTRDAQTGGPHLRTLPDSPDGRLGEWLEREFRAT